jgi:predicted CoA-substrate-specific enzyme activase
MNTYHVTYRIPFGFNDILEKRKTKVIDSQKADLLQQFNAITSGFRETLSPEILKRLRLMFVNVPIEPSEKDTSLITDFLREVLHAVPLTFQSASSGSISIIINHESAKVNLHYNETDLLFSVSANHLRLDKRLKTLLVKMDEMFRSFGFLIYKYIHDGSRSEVFSNTGNAWSRRMRGFIGVDVGSVSTNVVFLDEHDNVIETVYTYTRGRVLDAIKTSFTKLQQMLPSNVEILGVGTTGSSGEMAKAILNADTYRTEIYSHAAATIHQIPAVQTILEIGGQDSKVIYISNGIPEKSKMNEWCGAGTGAMLDAQANRLGIPIEKFGDYALMAKKSIDFRTRCGVFMDSCMIDAQAKGYPIETIVAGLCKACAKNFVNTLGINRKALGFPIVFQGGVSANVGVKRELEKFIGEARGEDPELVVPLYHDVMGAIGMALIIGRLHKKRNIVTSFRGFDDVYRITSMVIQCGIQNCPRKLPQESHCDLVELMVDGQIIAAIGACEEYNEAVARTDQKQQAGTTPPDACSAST